MAARTSGVVLEPFRAISQANIFSRRIVAARVYEAENDDNAAILFQDVQRAEKLAPGQVTLHADNGGAMKCAPLEATLDAMLERLGISASYTGPKVSDDSPFVIRNAGLVAFGSANLRPR